MKVPDQDAVAAAVGAVQPEETVRGETAPHLLRSKARAEIDPAGVTVTDVPMEVELGENLDPILEFFGLDPACFTVVDDTVRISKWQQSKRLESGDRDTIWLWSYSARFAKTPARLRDADLADLRDHVRGWDLTAAAAPVPDSYTDGAAFVILLADWQLGKGRLGLHGLVTYLQATLARALTRLAELRASGRVVDHVVLVNMGDPTEGCDGNYANQRASTITQREQLLNVLELWAQWVKAFAPLAPRLSFVSVLCNHGEWMRRDGSKGNVTDDSDNVGGYLADTLRLMLEGRAGLEHVEWHVPHDEMTLLVDVNGVPSAFAHGHKFSGSGEKAELSWLQGQSIRLLRHHGREPRLWFTAHRHHDSQVDFGAFWRHQACSADQQGSKWYEDTAGVWSTPGTTTMLVGQHEAAGGRGWSDKQLL